MNTTSEMRLVPIDKLIPYVNNARTHSPEQLNKLRSSRVSSALSIPLSSTGVSTSSQATEEYLPRKPRTSPKCLAYLLDYLTPAQKKAYIIADNRNGS